MPVCLLTKLNMLCSWPFAVGSGEFGLDVEDYLTGSLYALVSLLSELDVI